MESKYEGVAPKLVLLSLLAECCMVTTTQTQVSPDPHMMTTLTTDPWSPGPQCPGDRGPLPGAHPHPAGPDGRGPGPDEPHRQLHPGGLPHVRGATTGRIL